MSDEIEFRVDDKDAMKELNRLGRLPYGAGGELGTGLKASKEEIRSHIHVLTGKLKSRLNDKSHQVGKLWEGTITIGTGLGYAVYEKDREGVKEGTGTLHDFIAASDAEVHATMVAALLKALEK